MTEKKPVGAPKKTCELKTQIGVSMTRSEANMADRGADRRSSTSRSAYIVELIIEDDEK